MKLAGFFKHNFTKGLFKLYDKNGNVIFYEDLYKSWERCERNESGEITFWEDSDGNTGGTPRPKETEPIKEQSELDKMIEHNKKIGEFLNNLKNK